MGTDAGFSRGGFRLSSFTCISRRDGELWLDETFLEAAEAEACFVELHETLAWQSETYQMYGRRVTAPRLVAWYGEPEAVYAYSGIRHEPLPWLPLLSQLRQRVEAACRSVVADCRFNSVLANLYRDGNDSMGWHADKEKELGPQPLIASLSLGATRTFQIQHQRSKERLKLPLPAGSLLFMAGDFQRSWRHAVPKEKGITQARINLTFRLVQAFTS